VAAIDLNVSSIIAATGWTGATVANLTTSNDVRATNGTAAEFISAELDDAPGDFGSQNTIQLHVEARVVGTVTRAKSILFELRNSSETVLQTFTTSSLTASDVVYSSTAFSRSDALSVINAYRLRATVLEGGGMADTATVEIDRMWAVLDYNAAAVFAPEQNAFRFYDDDAAEDASTPLGAQDANAEVNVAAGDATVQLRLRIDETAGGAGATTDDWQLQYSKNAAAFADVAAASSNVKSPGVAGGNPVVEATATSSTETAGTTHTVALPTGILSGDLLVAGFAVDGNQRQVTVTWPAGWAELFDLMNDDNFAVEAECGGSIAYRVADGTEGSSITVTTSESETSAHTVYRISGAGTPEFAPARSLTTPDASPDPPELTYSGGSGNHLWLAWSFSDDLDAVTGFPTDYTDGITVSAGSSGACTIGSARRKLAAATDNPGVFTLAATEEWVAATVVAPSAGGGGGSSLTDGAATTNRATNGIGDPGTGSFVAGEQEVGNGLIENRQLTAGNFTEHVWALTLVAADLANADTLEFRVLLNGAPITAGVTPQITVSTTTNATATGGQALQTLAQAGAGIEQPDGAGGGILAAPQQSGTGTHTEQVGGTGAQSFVPLAQAASAAEAIAGLADQALAALAEAGSGVERFASTGAQALAPPSQAGAAVEVAATAGAQTLAPALQSASGVEQPEGAGAQIVVPLAQAAAATSGQTITGAAAQTLALVATSATGLMAPEGFGAQLLAQLAQSASGDAGGIGGSADQSLQPPAQSGAAAEILIATGASLAAELAQFGSGVIAIAGAGQQSLNLPFQIAQALLQPAGTGVQFAGAAVQAGTAAEVDTGAAASLIAALTQQASGAPPFHQVPGRTFAARRAGAAAVAMTRTFIARR
jgi:hypothetical protein